MTPTCYILDIQDTEAERSFLLFIIIVTIFLFFNEKLLLRIILACNGISIKKRAYSEILESWGNTT